jgi:hypothetical protein
MRRGPGSRSARRSDKRHEFGIAYALAASPPLAGQLFASTKGWWDAPIFMSIIILS